MAGLHWLAGLPPARHQARPLHAGGLERDPAGGLRQAGLPAPPAPRQLSVRPRPLHSIRGSAQGSAQPVRPNKLLTELPQFHCDSGAMMEGSGTVYCDGNTWNDTAPVCLVPADPPLLTALLEGEETPGPLVQPGQTVDLLCQVRF